MNSSELGPRDLIIEHLAGIKYIDLKATEVAKSKLTSEEFTGSIELTIDDLKATQGSFLVHDLIAVESINFMIARSNIGKTFAYVDMSCRIALGLPWLGKQTNPAKILIVLGEGKAGFYQRLEAWLEVNGYSIDDIRGKLFFIDGANLFNDESIKKIAEVAKREQANLIIFDTWSATSGVTDENAGALNSEALNRASKIRPESALLFIHHPTKTTELSERPEMRGSSALKGRADCVMTLYDDRGFTPTAGGKREWIALSTTFEHGGKNRNARTETIRGLYLADLGEDKKFFAQLESESMSKQAAKVREKLVGVVTVLQFADAINMSPATARRYLDAASQEGIAICYKGLGPNEPDRYELSDVAKRSLEPNFAYLAEVHIKSKNKEKQFWTKNQ
jgi:hypothetical protein